MDKFTIVNVVYDRERIAVSVRKSSTNTLMTFIFSASTVYDFIKDAVDRVSDG
jgi:hypothetical protein